jgi:hypothetical protein
VPDPHADEVERDERLRLERARARATSTRPGSRAGSSPTRRGVVESSADGGGGGGGGGGSGNGSGSGSGGEVSAILGANSAVDGHQRPMSAPPFGLTASSSDFDAPEAPAAARAARPAFLPRLGGLRLEELVKLQLAPLPLDLEPTDGWMPPLPCMPMPTDPGPLLLDPCYAPLRQKALRSEIEKLCDTLAARLPKNVKIPPSLFPPALPTPAQLQASDLLSLPPDPKPPPSSPEGPSAATESAPVDEEHSPDVADEPKADEAREDAKVKAGGSGELVASLAAAKVKRKAGGKKKAREEAEAAAVHADQGHAGGGGGGGGSQQGAVASDDAAGVDVVQVPFGQGKGLGGAGGYAGGACEADEVGGEFARAGFLFVDDEGEAANGRHA